MRKKTRQNISLMLLELIMWIVSSYVCAVYLKIFESNFPLILATLMTWTIWNATIVLYLAATTNSKKNQRSQFKEQS